MKKRENREMTKPIRQTEYWNVRVLATKEEKDFETRPAAIEWCRKVAHTFQQTMDFEVEQITHKTYALNVKYE
jgi:hypothetical protein